MEAERERTKAEPYEQANEEEEENEDDEAILTDKEGDVSGKDEVKGKGYNNTIWYEITTKLINKGNVSTLDNKNHMK